MTSQTYTIASVATSFAPNKSMLSIFNGIGSGRIVRVYRIWLLNNQTTAVTGVITSFTISKLSAASGGSSLTPVKHDNNNEDLPAQIICSSGATVTSSATYRTFVWSNDEPVVSAGTWDELECLPALACVWDLGYADSNVNPILLREGEGVAVRHTGTSIIGLIDIFIEFTIANS